MNHQPKVVARQAAKRKHALIVGVAMLTLLAGCSNATESPDSVSIGYVNPRSGPLAELGLAVEDGLRLVIDETNQNGGIESLGGATIELHIADDGGDPTRAATEARRLISQEGIALLTGVTITPTMAAVAPVVDQFGTPVLSAGAGGSQSELIYSVGHSYDKGYAATLVQFIEWLSGQPGFEDIERVAVIGTNNETGLQVAGATDEMLGATPLTSLGQFPHDAAATDLTNPLLEVQQQEPDAMIGYTTVPATLALLRARYALEAYDTILVTPNGGDPVTWDTLGEGLASEVLSRNYFSVVSAAEEVDLDSVKSIFAALNSAGLEHDVGEVTAIGAQVGAIIVDALERAGSVEPAAILDALASTDIPVGSEKMYLPREDGIRFAEDRLFTDPRGVVIQWAADGTRQVVWPEAFASSAPVKYEG